MIGYVGLTLLPYMVYGMLRLLETPNIYMYAGSMENELSDIVFQ
jgi:hypothetical protein